MKSFGWLILKRVKDVVSTHLSPLQFAYRSIGWQMMESIGTTRHHAPPSLLRKVTQDPVCGVQLSFQHQSKEASPEVRPVHSANFLLSVDHQFLLIHKNFGVCSFPISLLSAHKWQHLSGLLQFEVDTTLTGREVLICSERYPSEVVQERNRGNLWHGHSFLRLRETHRERGLADVIPSNTRTTADEIAKEVKYGPFLWLFITWMTRWLYALGHGVGKP